MTRNEIATPLLCSVILPLCGREASCDSALNNASIWLRRYVKQIELPVEDPGLILLRLNCKPPICVEQFDLGRSLHIISTAGPAFHIDQGTADLFFVLGFSFTKLRHGMGEP